MSAPDAAQLWTVSLWPTVTAADSVWAGTVMRMPESSFQTTRMNCIPKAAEGRIYPPFCFSLTLTQPHA